jgi:hypothetical protein
VKLIRFGNRRFVPDTERTRDAGRELPVAQMSIVVRCLESERTEETLP